MRQNRCEVWTASVTDFGQHEPALAAALTPDEQTYVAALADPTTATLSRAVLRLLLARYLDVAAEEVVIDRSCPDCGRPHGRPRLPEHTGAATLSPQFSVSHGGDLLVLAFLERGRVGVDVEPDLPGEVVGVELLELALTTRERTHVTSVPTDQRRRLFLHYWTGKEAVLKAVGTGLDSSLQAVALPAPPNAATTAVTIPGSGPVKLAVRYLDLGAAHVGALATAEPVLDLQVTRLSPAALLAPPIR